MKVSRKVLCFSLVIAASISFGQDVRTSIQAHYDTISKLAIDKKGSTLAKLMTKKATSNFEYVDAMGNTMDLSATIRQNVEQLSGVIDFASNSNKIIASKMKGNDYVFTVKTSYDATVKIKGKKSRVEGISLSEDTWTKTLVGWKLMRSRTTKESLFKDGKPMKV